MGDSMAQWLASRLVAREVVSSMLGSPVLQLPSEARRLEQLITVTAVT